MSLITYLQNAIDTNNPSLTIASVIAETTGGEVVVDATSPPGWTRCPSPALTAWLNATLAGCDPSFDVVSLTVVLTSGYEETASVTSPPPPPPTPPPFPHVPPADGVTITRIVQANNVYYHNISGSADDTINAISVSQGGLVSFLSSGTLTINDCYSEGAPAGSGHYFVIVATGGAGTVNWNNTNVPGRWIVNGNEAVARFMGAMGDLNLTNVDIVTRLHKAGDSSGAFLSPIPTLYPSLVQPTLPSGWPGQTEWKQGFQFRDIHGTAVCQGTMPNKSLPDGCGRFVGLIDIGRQVDTGGVGQYVNDLTFHQYGFQKLPHFTDLTTIGIVRMQSCWKIDKNGKVIVDSSGQIAMWPDRSWP